MGLCTYLIYIYTYIYIYITRFRFMFLVFLQFYHVLSPIRWSWSYLVDTGSPTNYPFDTWNDPNWLDTLYFWLDLMVHLSLWFISCEIKWRPNSACFMYTHAYKCCWFPSWVSSPSNGHDRPAWRARFEGTTLGTFDTEEVVHGPSTAGVTPSNSSGSIWRRRYMAIKLATPKFETNPIHSRNNRINRRKSE